MRRTILTHRRFFTDAEAIASILSEQYGDHSHGNKTNPLNELLFIICSLQTNEALYRSTYVNLRMRFPTAQRLAEASESDIAAAIARGGLAHQKARTIRNLLSRLKSDFGEPSLAPLRAMEDAECEAYLTSLPGVGRKTARCVMMYSLGRDVFPVDSNCWRIGRRLGWVRPTRPDASCSPRDMDRMQAGIPAQLRFGLHVNLVSHGRACCRPAVPQCDTCLIRQYCRKGRATA